MTTKTTTTRRKPAKSFRRKSGASGAQSSRKAQQDQPSAFKKAEAAKKVKAEKAAAEKAKSTSLACEVAVRAHITKWAWYDDKAHQHATSAAVILAEVKAELPHGQYGPWLKKYAIAPRTASRLLLEYHSPEKADERRSYQEQQNTKAKEMRRAAKSVVHDQSPAPVFDAEHDAVLFPWDAIYKCLPPKGIRFSITAAEFEMSVAEFTEHVIASYKFADKKVVKFLSSGKKQPEVVEQSEETEHRAT